MLLSRSPRWGGRYIFIDVGVCALFGGYTVLSTKALSSLLSVMFLAAFEEWVTWMLFFVLIGTSIMQIKYLNKALMRFQSKASGRFSLGNTWLMGYGRKSYQCNLSFSPLQVCRIVVNKT